MRTDQFIDAMDPEILYTALDSISPPAGRSACATHDPHRFTTPRRQQATFDGEPVDPARDIASARALCARCPILAACNKYAEMSGDEITFLAGQTAVQRQAHRSKTTEIARRRLRVRALLALGAPTPVIAELLGRDPSLIRGDIRTIRPRNEPAA
jgi:transcription factor WhiB